MNMAKICNVIYDLIPVLPNTLSLTDINQMEIGVFSATRHPNIRLTKPPTIKAIKSYNMSHTSSK